MIISVNDITQKLENRKPKTIGKHKFFSVVIPVIEEKNGLSILFEVRASSLKTQPGDICFPGGSMEEGETALECALREMEEEIGIAPSDVRVIGQFDTLYGFSGYTLYTFIVSMKADVLENLNPSINEVEEVFTVPIEFFLENKPESYDVDVVSDVSAFPYDKTGISPEYNWRKGKNVLPLYRYNDKIIWGMTARIVKWFCEQLLC